jgi:hypothetical protein
MDSARLRVARGPFGWANVTLPVRGDAMARKTRFMQWIDRQRAMRTKALRSQFHTLWYRVRRQKSLWVFALGQRLRRFADHVATTTGMANGERVRQGAVWTGRSGWVRLRTQEFPGARASGRPVRKTLLEEEHE